MIPVLQPCIGGSLSDEQLLLPAAALHAAAAPLDHMLGCEVTQDEASVWADAACANAGTAMVMRACIVTQVRLPALHPHLCRCAASHALQFGRDERPLLATVAARARTHLAAVSDVAAALCGVACSLHRYEDKV